MDKMIIAIKESYNELLHKVTWPTWQSLLGSTRLVFIASAIIALLIFVMDVISSAILTDFIYKFGR